jgi:hypothetical protein
MGEQIAAERRPSRRLSRCSRDVPNRFVSTIASLLVTRTAKAAWAADDCRADAAKVLGRGSISAALSWTRPRARFLRESLPSATWGSESPASAATLCPFEEDP